MTQPTQQLWEAVLSDIEHEVSRANFLTLFKSTALLSLEDNIATIAAPSTMMIDLLQKRFKDTIKTAIESHTKTEVDIFFVARTVARESLPKEDSSPLFGPTEIQRPKMPVGHLPRVRADFTFESLAVSDANRLAYESSRNVAKNPGRSYNPLFIYGPVGVGKTHVMQAIANEVYSQDPNNKIIYITSEEFTNEVVEAIRSNDTARMKKKFRSANLLIIDDVQFIAGKDRVQEELFHTFNSLIDSGAQIVLSSDRPPSEIKKLEARLSSRFAGGLTVDVEAPDFELRTAIVLKKAEKFGYNVSMDVAKFIAEKEQDVRSLEGTLLRIITQTAASGSIEITEAVAVKALGNGGVKDKSHMLHAEDVIESTCSFFNIKPTQLKGPKRDASLVKARQIAMYLLKNELKLTYVEIGNILGGRDHTTVMHGVEKMETLASEESVLHEEIMGISKMMRG
ncbi:MAG TPA: chromosomal replication initiator protein DnaA [Candidatus Saccharimonadales bacterium]|nr:chromosomal replication initiator protein DnaA [Candidatus Saccharimonadales bacterium]